MPSMRMDLIVASATSCSTELLKNVHILNNLLQFPHLFIAHLNIENAAKLIL